MENNDSDAKLIPFLRDLANSIERQQLLPKQTQIIGEFFMSYQFQEQAIRDNDNSTPPPSQFSHDDLLKFLTLGWYVYSVILNERSQVMI